jgi:hypothetical protein
MSLLYAILECPSKEPRQKMLLIIPLFLDLPLNYLKALQISFIEFFLDLDSKTIDIFLVF